MIHISSMSLRTDLVSHTNAFSISLPHNPPNDGVISIPFFLGNDIPLEFFIHRSEDSQHWSEICGAI